MGDSTLGLAPMCISTTTKHVREKIKTIFLIGFNTFLVISMFYLLTKK